MSEHPEVRIVCSKGATVPKYASRYAAGFDIAIVHDVVIPAGGKIMAETGLKVAFPHIYVLKIYPRSGLAKRHSVVLGNGVGIIDSDYRGEIFLSLYNYGRTEARLEAGTRVAQGILQRHAVAEFLVVDELEPTERGEGGHGSTGMK